MWRARTCVLHASRQPAGEAQRVIDIFQNEGVTVPSYLT